MEWQDEALKHESQWIFLRREQCLKRYFPDVVERRMVNAEYAKLSTTKETLHSMIWYRTERYGPKGVHQSFTPCHYRSNYWANLLFFVIVKEIRVLIPL